MAGRGRRISGVKRSRPENRQDGSLFTSRHGGDRSAEREPDFVNVQEPPGGILTLDASKRTGGSLYNFVQPVSVISNAGRVRLRKIFVDHLWDNINTRCNTINFAAAGVPLQATLTTGIYTAANLALELTSILTAAAGAAITVTTAVDATTGRSRFFITTPALVTFQWLNCNFIANGNHTHGFSVPVPGTPTGWGPDPTVIPAATGPVVAAGFANMVYATQYTIRSSNITKADKMESYGTATDTIGAFYVSTNLQGVDLQDRDFTSQETIEYNEPHQTSSTHVKQIGGPIDIEVVDQYGFTAEATQVVTNINGGGAAPDTQTFNNPTFVLEFVISMHY